MDPLEWFTSVVMEDNLLFTVAAWVAILTVPTSAVYYFSNKDSHRRRTSKSLYIELEDTLKSLDHEKHEKESYNVEITNAKGGKETVFFMNRILNHDIYDSLIFSGWINFLEPKLQQMVQDTFKRIKTHNKHLEAVGDIQNDQLDEIPQNSISTYFEWMSNNEFRLKKEIPEIMENLKKHTMLFAGFRSWFARL